MINWEDLTKYCFLWVLFNIKTLALHWLLLNSCYNSSVLERAAAPLCCHHWISLIQRLSVCALQIMMISCLDQSSFFKFWLTFTWSLLRKNNIFQSMSEHGRPESSQEVEMPKNRDCWWVEMYQAEARWSPLVDGFGKYKTLEQDVWIWRWSKIQQKDRGFLGYRWFDGYIALRPKAMHSREGLSFGTKDR